MPEKLKYRPGAGSAELNRKIQGIINDNHLDVTSRPLKHSVRQPVLFDDNGVTMAQGRGVADFLGRLAGSQMAAPS